MRRGSMWKADRRLAGRFGWDAEQQRRHNEGLPQKRGKTAVQKKAQRGGGLMRIYISGPMTGKPDLNREAFYLAEVKLRNAWHFVINPFDISGDFGTEEELAKTFAALYWCDDHLKDDTSADDFAEVYPKARIARCVMDADLAAVRACDAIYLLRGWENSRGAKKELAEALKHRIEVNACADSCYSPPRHVVEITEELDPRLLPN